MHHMAPQLRHGRRARLAIAALLGSALAAQQNVLLVVADDLGVDSVGCYAGATAPPTPNIDALAAAGVRFTQAHACPSCSPTRAAIMTGRYGVHTGVTGALAGADPGIDPAETLLPTALATTGYARALVGKWHLGTRFGNALSQNARGELVTQVIDATEEDQTPRMYRSNLELRLHNDITAMISLACWNPSLSGGVSVIASARRMSPAVGDGEVDLPEASPADPPLEGEPLERSLSGTVGELHRGPQCKSSLPVDRSLSTARPQRPGPRLPRWPWPTLSPIPSLTGGRIGMPPDGACLRPSG